MPVFGERRHRHVGDVLDVDERLAHPVDGQRELAREHGLEEVALAEVLREPAAAHDRPVGARVLHGTLGALGLLLAATRQQHEPPHAAGDGLLGERRHRLGRAGHGEIREVGHVHRVDAAQRGLPGRGVLPVEARLARAGTCDRGDVARRETLHHAPAGLAGGAEDQCVGVGGGVHATQSTAPG